MLRKRQINGFYFFILLFALCLMQVSCSPTRHLPQGKSLHSKTNIIIENEKEAINKAALKQNLYNISRPKLNSRFFGTFRMKMQIHNWFSDHEKGAGAWLNERLGEPPVLLDSILLERSMRSMSQRLFNQGYFYSDVSFETTTKYKLSTVDYRIKLQPVYRIDTVVYPLSSDTNHAQRLIHGMQKESLLQTGQQFRTEQLNAEISRITQKMLNIGYYEFSRSYLSFDLDSTKNNRTIDVYLKLIQPRDSAIHKQYFIDSIFVHTDYLPNQDSIYTDTTFINNCYYISPKKNRFNADALTHFLVIAPNRHYSKRDYETTINHYLGLGIFKFATIKYNKVGTRDNKSRLNCNIYLTSNKKMHIAAEAEINNRSESTLVNSLLGTALNFSYNNRNLFKGAEVLKLNLFTGLEINPVNTDANLNSINTLNISGELSVKIPRFLSPLPLRNSSLYYLPTTRFSLNTSYVRRINYYTVNTNNIAITYDWRRNKRKRYIVMPLSVSLVSILDREVGFIEQIETDALLEKSFEEQIIIGTNFSYIYTNQEPNKSKNFIYFRGNIDFAGNMVYGAENVLKWTNIIQDNQELVILGNPYSQYTRVDGDLRHYQIFHNKTSLVTRLAIAAAYPYGNSRVLPYVKQYFVGGTNSVRAFGIRRIGPGAFGPNTVGNNNDIDEFDRTGDFKIEGSIEYRFDITSIFKGAIFTDFGNVWTLRQTTDDAGDIIRPEGIFGFNDWYKELGVGIGAGLRLDFSYFVMRFDLAIPVRDPNLAVGKRWIGLNDRSKNKACLNLAIGYPF
ncbi:MAG: BamA/TamA family outer membrane protein [Chitinophagales bacterium]